MACSIQAPPIEILERTLEGLEKIGSNERLGLTPTASTPFAVQIPNAFFAHSCEVLLPVSISQRVGNEGRIVVEPGDQTDPSAQRSQRT